MTRLVKLTLYLWGAHSVLKVRVSNIEVMKIYLFFTMVLTLRTHAIHLGEPIILLNLSENMH